jgi:mannose-1-phosphate guanylyltransferase / mannose-6-phosphate isomerase
VGSWNAVSDPSTGDEADNRIQGQDMFRGASNTFVYAPHHPVVALGTTDLLVIDTPVAVQVAHLECPDRFKVVVTRLDNPGKMELEMIEVLSGSYLGEDDIVRLSDTYGCS